MIYLFSYQNKNFVLGRTERVNDKIIASLTKLDDSKIPTSKKIFLKGKTNYVFEILFDSIVNDYTLTYEKIQEEFELREYNKNDVIRYERNHVTISSITISKAIQA
ncbi:MAG: hypothetical protein K2K06_11415, partial [Oscillospiraceae bacterium]|nr:hypothetical protein [Oscillospiraceae bacterium]